MQATVKLNEDLHFTGFNPDMASVEMDGSAEAKDRPVHFQEIFATLYRSLGIDPHATTVADLTGRPRYLVEGDHFEMPELI